MNDLRLFDHLPVSEDLTALYKEFVNIQIKELFDEDENRFENFSVSAAGLFLDYSKNKVNDKIMQALVNLAEQSGVESLKKAMYNGDKINFTENRAVLHIALRQNQDSATTVDYKIMKKIAETREKMHSIVDDINNKTWLGYTGQPIKHVVNIGIGGSNLGLQNVLAALEPYKTSTVDYHFIANIDPTDTTQILNKIDLETTVFIIASKSFNTLETLVNAKAIRQKLIESGCPETGIKQHFIAISSNLAATEEFGIEKQNTLPIWDWVGGRFSLWSSIGLIIAIILGYKNYTRLLKGANKMDEHFLAAPIEKNMPIIIALLGVWYQNYFNTQTHAIVSYDNRLKYLTEHIQQVDMESNGKRTRKDCSLVSYDTGGIVWGGVGANSQHAYMQLIHQGTREVPIDFILPIKSHNPVGKQQELLLANALAQSKAMMDGKTKENIYTELLEQGFEAEKAETLAKHKSMPGNKPSNTILIEKLTPETLGALIALYEHKVFAQGLIWGINSFDQWGVELGKQISDDIMQAMTTKNYNYKNHDGSTDGLLNKIKDSIE